MQMDNDSNWMIGKSLGQFRIVEIIGSGGWASVFKAYQPTLDRYVAIKVLPAYYARDPVFVKRFVQETRSVAKLAHPNIVQIHDYGDQEGITYIVMEYVDGGTLKDRLKQQRALPVSEAVDFIIQAAEGLNCAHNHGIIHRDVKPANMLVRKDGRLLLSDFGIAKILEGTTNLTRAGTGIGTPQYMSPEQGTGQPMDRRSDIYSLGIVLYECLTGRVPFTADNPLTITVMHLNNPLPVESLRMAGVPTQLEQVVLKMTAKSPQDRFQWADEVANALREALTYLQFPNSAVPQTQQQRLNEVQASYAISEQTFPPNQPTIRIFVSHSSKDDAFGRKLVKDLSQALGSNEAVWYDSSGGLHGGDAWWDTIVDELTTRNVFILILSPDAVESKWVRDELRIAWQQKNAANMRIVPVLYRESTIRADLRTLQIISFLPPRNYEAAFEELLTALRLR